MIGKIETKISADRQQVPLATFVSFAGSPSTVVLTGIPEGYGNVRVKVTGSNSEIHSYSAYADGKDWICGIPSIETSPVKIGKGFSVVCDEIEDGEVKVEGFVLGVGDCVWLDSSPDVNPSISRTYVRLADEFPENPLKGDLAFDGGLKLYNGSKWIQIALPDEIPTKVSQLENDNGYQIRSQVVEAAAELVDESASHLDEKIVQTKTELQSQILTFCQNLSGRVDGVKEDLDEVEKKIPSKVSSLENDSKYQTEEEVNGKVSSSESSLKSYTDNAVKAVEEGYVEADNKVKALIPVKVSSLDNDSGYVKQIEFATEMKRQQDALDGHYLTIQKAIDGYESKEDHQKSLDSLERNLKSYSDQKYATIEDSYTRAQIQSIYSSKTDLADVKEELQGEISTGDLTTLDSAKKYADSLKGQTDESISSLRKSISTLESDLDATNTVVAVNKEELSGKIDSVQKSIPVKVSSLENDSGYQTKEEVSTTVNSAVSEASSTLTTAYKAADLVLDTRYSEKCSSLEGEIDEAKSQIEVVEAKIPVNVSELFNDSGYAYQTNVTTEIGERISASEEKISAAYKAADSVIDTKYAEKCSAIQENVNLVKESIPTKVSQLDNDKRYATEGDWSSWAKHVEDQIPKKVSSLENDSGYQTKEDVQTSISSAISASETSSEAKWTQADTNLKTELEKLVSDTASSTTSEITTAYKAADEALDSKIDSTKTEIEGKIPTKVSVLENDSGYQTGTEVQTACGEVKSFVEQNYTNTTGMLSAIKVVQDDLDSTKTEISKISGDLKWSYVALPASGESGGSIQLENHRMNLVDSTTASGCVFQIPAEDSQLLEFGLVFPSNWDVTKTFSIDTSGTPFSYIVEEGALQLSSGEVNVLCFMQLNSTQIALAKRNFT